MLSGTCIISCLRRRVHRVVLQYISVGTIGMSCRGGRDLIHAKILTIPIHPTSLWRSMIYLVSFFAARILEMADMVFILTNLLPFFVFYSPTPILPPFSLFYSLIPNFLGAPPMAWHFTPTRTRTHPAKIPPAPIPPPNLTNLLPPPPTVLLLTIPP